MLKKFLLVLLLILISACTSVQGDRTFTQDLRTSVAQTNFDGALSIIKNKKFYDDENSKLLNYLENGTAHYLRGEYYQALQFFDQAKKLGDELYTVSLSKKLAGTWDANLDNYYGEKYELSLIRFYLSLIHYNLYKTGVYEEFTTKDGILVAKKQLTNAEKNTHLFAARGTILEWDSLLKTFQNETVGESTYKNDMLAKIWGAFIHQEINTNEDKQIASVLYKDAQQILFRYYNLYPTFNTKASDFDKDFKKLPKMSNELLNKNYIAETKHSKQLSEFLNKKIANKNAKNNVVFMVKEGLISPRKATKIDIPIPLVSFGSNVGEMMTFISITMLMSNGVPYFRLEIPDIDTTNYFPKEQWIVIENKNNTIKLPLTVVEPISEIAKKNVKDELLALQAGAVARITAKYVAAITASYALYNQGGFAQVAALATFYGATKVIANTSMADIRYWSTLSSTVKIADTKLPKGEYKFKVIEKTIESTTQQNNRIIINYNSTPQGNVNIQYNTIAIAPQESEIVKLEGNLIVDGENTTFVDLNLF